jgi:hypothetical protein
MKAWSHPGTINYGKFNCQFYSSALSLWIAIIYIAATAIIAILFAFLFVSVRYYRKKISLHHSIRFFRTTTGFHPAVAVRKVQKQSALSECTSIFQNCQSYLPLESYPVEDSSVENHVRMMSLRMQS